MLPSPSTPPMMALYTAAGPMLTDYEQIIFELSERIVAAQKPIRILDSIKWDLNVREEFFKNKGKKLPNVDREYYTKQPLTYDPAQKIEEFRDIEKNIRRKLGQFSGVGSIMQRMCHEYSQVVDMLQNRGTPKFTEISQELYGSSEDAFHVGAPTLKDLAALVSDILTHIQGKVSNKLDEKIYTSEETVALLSKRLESYFPDSNSTPRVVLSDGIIADAAAGAESIRIHTNMNFSERDLRVFEVHEGWVHLGTTLNGMMQPVCTFLSKGPPSSTVTQEGLAIITEVFTFASYPGRVQRLTNRITAVGMAEAGANFIEVYEFFREQYLDEIDAYHSTARVFRGSTPDGGPFTKDLSYSKGFILIYNYIRLAVQRGLVMQIPYLFLGKTTLEDIHILSDLVEEKIVVPPKYMPPQFQDLAALSAWMCYSLFLNKLDLQRLATDFKGILL